MPKHLMEINETKCNEWRILRTWTESEARKCPTERYSIFFVYNFKLNGR